MSRKDKDAATAKPVSENDCRQQTPTGETANSDACHQPPAWQADPDAGLAYASCGTTKEPTPEPGDHAGSPAVSGHVADVAARQDAQVTPSSDPAASPAPSATTLPDPAVPGEAAPAETAPDATGTAGTAETAGTMGRGPAGSPSDAAARGRREPDDVSLPAVDDQSAATGTAVAPAPPRDLSEAENRANGQEAESSSGGRPMTLLGHLSELRIRLVRCLIALAAGFFACYGFAEHLFNYLMIPLTKALPAGAKLIYTALPEAFFVYMQVALVAGTFLASPYLFYQIWAFIAPGLYDEEKRHVIPIAGASALFFVAGAAFCYFQVFPYAFAFFVGFATDTIAPMPKLDEYLGFTLKMLLAFGLIFEMPLFAFFLSRLGIVTAQWMRKTRKYAILAIFIVAAILTPPDVFSQLMMATPMLVLYEISILVAALCGKKKSSPDEDGGAGESGRKEHGKHPGSDTAMQGDEL